MENKPKIIEYVEAIGRNEGEGKISHMYARYDNGDYLPMCRKGWNRDDGGKFSILRGHHGTKGLCKTCKKCTDAKLEGVEAKEGSHKTKWL